ncbi:uncharacterized protein N7496_008355 [Penicillium cataractarum]|uniref:RRM domain-containing protein n=1 Tax=Penicillium cataractarum TaxID=2100454 RepID=A0A9W9RZJ6_9EURO|nr:uncharacterized protein N7496_008355 [Penicillium cataractarum]KAJ5368595.1 hypothetical protein N7496_008355 [Penicillium cataractarum]
MAPIKSTLKTAMPNTVSITAEEYRKLLHDSAELSRLRAALQPAPRETKGMLINPVELASGHVARVNTQTAGELARTARPDLCTASDLDAGDRFALASLASALEETSTTEPEDDSESRQKPSSSVVLLPPVPVTHAQVAAAVRGGPLIQIYLQRNSNQVNVTFAHPEAAAALITHAESTHFYVAGHKTIVKWAPRAYIAPQYVYQQVQDGTVSRNLVIKKVNATVTEESLRRDLKHIHNLTIISIKFENENVYISTSSTGGALYARTCLKSRAAYKDMRIDFYEDECAKPLPKTRRSAAVAVPKAPKKDQSPGYNPFELLSQDEFELADDEDDDEDEDEDIEI